MATFKLYLIISTGRKALVLLYNLAVLTSLIATAIRDLHCDVSVLPVDGTSSLMQTRPAAAETNEVWSKRILYAAAAIANTSRKHRTEGRRTRQPSTSTTQMNGQYGQIGSTGISYDYSVISEACSGDHGLEIQQDNTTFYFEGLPVYHVTMVNTCVDCSLQNIHIACGDWASATEVNPLVFKRVAENDCIVNDGKPLLSQGAVIFEYTNSFPYPMDLRSSLPSCS